VEGRCRANMAHVRQSGPDSGLGFQVNFLGMIPATPIRHPASRIKQDPHAEGHVPGLGGAGAEAPPRWVIFVY